jgi:hypothetical protein
MDTRPVHDFFQRLQKAGSAELDQGPEGKAEGRAKDSVAATQEDSVVATQADSGSFRKQRRKAPQRKPAAPKTSQAASKQKATPRQVWFDFD